ncbi:hypothetical protein GLOIN_2v1476493 [Rhizophagus irregularis DAOM 181602=DAOM 197198]|nr:hypothetical protein GLOIN_2v1476493 [Rhizophagus irregularis DAOM 181602=DAOM 197198]
MPIWYPIGLGMNWYRSLRFLGQLLSFYSVHPTCNTIRGPFGFISASEGIISSFFVGIAVRTLASWTSSVEFLDVGWHLDLDWYRYRLRFLGSSSVFRYRLRFLVFQLDPLGLWVFGFLDLLGSMKLDQTKDQPAMNYLDISFLQFITKTTAYYVNNEESDGDFGSQFSQLNDLEVSNSIQLRDIGDELTLFLFTLISNTT